jgi:hydrogenase-4 component B
MAPVLLVRLIEPVVGFYGNLSAPAIAQVTSMVPLVPLTIANILLISLVLVIGTAYLLRLRRLPRSQGATWGCGFPEPTPRMQYTGTSFSEMVVSLLEAIVAPSRRRPTLAAAIPPADASFHYTVTETVLDRILTPIFLGVGLAFSYLRMVQHGQLHIYVLYIFATLCVLMIWAH